MLHLGNKELEEKLRKVHQVYPPEVASNGFSFISDIMMNDKENDKYVAAIGKIDFELIKGRLCDLSAVLADNVPKIYLTAYYNPRLPAPQVNQFISK